MTPKNTETGDATGLRRRAEAQARNMESASMSALDHAENQRLVHELQVHQIELEMQNEELRTVQAEIEAGRERYFDLYNLAPVGYCTLSEEGLILEANLTAATLLGTNRGALVKQPISSFILKDDQDAYYLHRKKLFETGEPQECELRLVKPDGTFIWAYLTATAAQAEDGTPVCRLALSDITKRKRAEEALRESNELYERLAAESRTIAWAIDTAGLYTYISPAMEDILGYRQEKIVGKLHFYDLHPEEGREAFKEEVFAAMQHKEAFVDMDNAIEAKDGGVVWVRTNANPILEADGSLRGYRGSDKDITERKQAETYREMGREILQILNEPGDMQESIPRVLAVLKTRTGVDAAGLRLQEGEDFPYFAQDGFPADFLETENTLVERGQDGGVCRDKDGKVCLECTCGLVISGKTDPSNPLFTKGGSSWTNDSFPLLDLPPNQDTRLHPRNNCIHQGYASVALIPVRTKDRIVGLIQFNDRRKDRFTLETIEILEGIAAHIGSALMRKQAESELRRLSIAIEQSPETVMITDTEGTIQYVNPAFEATAGYTREEAMGQNPRILKSGLQDAAFYTAMWKTLLDGRVWKGRMVNKRKDGSLYTEDASIAPVKDPSGTITNYVGVERDITSELKIEEQLHQAQKMESVGRLAGGVAHDFNNLLMGIMGYAELSRDALSVNHPVQEWLNEITREAQRSTDLTRQLLAFARKQTVAPQVLDLNDAGASMLKMLRRLIGEDIDLVWQPGAELGLVKIDPSQVDQILANLCVNARDAIDGVGKVTIETENVAIDVDYCEEHVEATPGSYVMLAVSDDGCGMDHETLANVFEPFFSTKPMGEGTGLGLATIYGIVKQNGGFVNVYSEPAKGTTFRIYLPREASADKAALEAATKTASQGGTETILLVEDEKAIRSTMRLFLERFGYTVIAAESPAEALQRVAEQSGPIDLLLTDVVMPGMSGRELAEKLAVDFPSMKVLYMSGYTANVIAHRGILEDGVQFISKPISRDALAQKVREVLEGGVMSPRPDSSISGEAS